MKSVVTKRPHGGEENEHTALPFDEQKLTALMDEQEIDLLLATSKHNVQYLLGGYRCSFFENMDALGLSRYLPVLGLPQGDFARAFYVGNAIERWQQQATSPPWVPEIDLSAPTSP